MCFPYLSLLSLNQPTGNPWKSSFFQSLSSLIASQAHAAPSASPAELQPLASADLPKFFQVQWQITTAYAGGQIQPYHTALSCFVHLCPVGTTRYTVYIN
jgi:hypothetical protein